MRKQDKVLMVTTSFPLTHQDVSGIFVSKLSQANQRYTIIVLTPASKAIAGWRKKNLYAFAYAPKSLQIIAQQPGGIPVALKNNKWLYLVVPFFLLSMLISCIRLSRKCRIIHANWAICGFISGLANKFTHKKLVTTLRGDDINRAKKSAIDRFFLNKTLKYSDKIILVSDNFQTWLSDQFPRYQDKLKTIFNGVDEALLDMGQQRQYPIKETYIITVIGSLIPRKGVAQIIKAVSNNTGQPVQLRIIGDGPETTALTHLVNTHHLQDQVRFLGEQPHAQISSYLMQTDIFVLASYSEGRPNVILEALASACPIVASNIPGTNELIANRENGLLFACDDIDQLTSHIIELTTNASLRKTLGQNGRQSILDQGLLWSNCAEQYSKIYDSLLD